MTWVKKGLIWQPDTAIWWQQHYGILPTPEFIPENNRIRLYFATTCAEKYGRITFIEVDADDPSKILRPATDWIADIGEIGCFDDCGLNPSCLIETSDGQKWLYYIGYQRSVRVPYMLLAGALRQNGQQWERVSHTPILERTHDEPCIRSATTIIRTQTGYKMWYVAAHRWELIDNELFKNKLLPNYLIKAAVSDDGKRWQVLDGVAIDYKNEDEFGFGRPWVRYEQGLYQMWYSIRSRQTSYRIGYAESSDGLHWQRKDEQVGIDVSAAGWDSEMICYPAVIEVKGRLFMFYNGNNNGQTGFGYAEWLPSGAFRTNF